MGQDRGRKPIAMPTVACYTIRLGLGKRFYGTCGPRGRRRLRLGIFRDPAWPVGRFLGLKYWRGTLLGGGLSVLILSLTACGADPTALGDPAPGIVANGESEHESIIFEDIRTEITRGNQRLQQIQARWGIYDREEETLDLQDLEITFFSKGEQVGEARCGRGMLWLTDDHLEKEGHGRHDVLLTDDVWYHTSEGWIVRTPRMRYTHLDTTLRSDHGYVKQIPVDGGFFISRGKRFEIKILVESGTFDYWRDFGSRIVLEKSETPELIP
jgi:hypothetical protein